MTSMSRYDGKHSDNLKDTILMLADCSKHWLFVILRNEGSEANTLSWFEENKNLVP